MKIIVKDRRNEYTGQIWQENNKLHIQFDVHHWVVNAKKYQKFMSALEAGKLQYFEAGSKRYEIRKETF